MKCCVLSNICCSRYGRSRKFGETIRKIENFRSLFVVLPNTNLFCSSFSERRKKIAGFLFFERLPKRTDELSIQRYTYDCKRALNGTKSAEKDNSYIIIVYNDNRAFDGNSSNKNIRNIDSQLIEQSAAFDSFIELSSINSAQKSNGPSKRSRQTKI